MDASGRKLRNMCNTMITTNEHLQYGKPVMVTKQCEIHIEKNTNKTEIKHDTMLTIIHDLNHLPMYNCFVIIRLNMFKNLFS